MNISGSSAALSRLTAYSVSKSSTIGSNSFGDALADASAKTSPAVTISLSAQALATSANLSASSVQSPGSNAPVLNQAFFERAYSASQSERNQIYRDAASAISASQGLPDGKYDFTKLSDAQAHVIENDLLLNKGISIDDLQGFTIPPGCSFDDPVTQQPRNLLQSLKNAIEFETSNGYSSAAHSHQLALDLMNQLTV